MANEKRLIDANALLEELDKFANPMPNNSGYDFLSGVATVITEIEDAPTVDAVEVVHGRWLLERTPDGKPYCFHCSVCDDDFGYIGISTAYRYCPNCGAKMDGGTA